MRPKRKDKGILKGVQVQGLRLSKDDVLVMKYPTREDGSTLYHVEDLNRLYNDMNKLVDCNVIFVPKNLELLKIKKDSAAYKELEKYKYN